MSSKDNLECFHIIEWNNVLCEVASTRHSQIIVSREIVEYDDHAH